MIEVTTKECTSIGSVLSGGSHSFPLQGLEDLLVAEALTAGVAELVPKRRVVWVSLPLRNDKLWV
jgi:hypothetical protein